jgi:hypothetical protein
MKKTALRFVMLIHPLRKINFTKAEPKPMIIPALAHKKQ